MAYKEPETINVLVNPDQLRKWADKIEDKYPTLLPGDSVFLDFLVCERELVIKLLIDQEWFHKNPPSIA